MCIVSYHEDHHPQNICTCHVLTVGVDVKGCGDCWQQCDVRHAPTKTSWWYTSQKNKSRIVANRISRTGQKLEKYSANPDKIQGT
jgi:hypothetical protein